MVVYQNVNVGVHRMICPGYKLQDLLQKTLVYMLALTAVLLLLGN